MLRKIFQKVKNNTSAFSLLETLIAIGIIAVVIGNVVRLQSSSISSTQVSLNHEKAIWIARSAISEIKYNFDTNQIRDMSEYNAKPWPNDPQFFLTVRKKPIKDIKASHFLIAAFKISEQFDPDRKSLFKTDFEETLKGPAQILDSAFPADRFFMMTVEVEWEQGDKKKKTENHFLLIDKAFK